MSCDVVLTYSGPLFIAAEEQLQVPVFKLLLQNRQAVIRKVAAVPRRIQQRKDGYEAARGGDALLAAVLIHCLIQWLQQCQPCYL